MSFRRLLPNTRDTPDETKRRVFESHGIVVVDLNKDQIPWEFKIWLEQWAEKRFGTKRR